MARFSARCAAIAMMDKNTTVGLALLPEHSESSARGTRAEALRILGLLSPGGAIARESGGRPYFADYRADFSISHSRNAAAVAVLPAPIPFPRGRSVSRTIPRIGCDIQYADPRKNYAAISRAFFHHAEQEYIFSANGEEQYRRFYRLWVLKEAWLKMRGLSVFDMTRTPVFGIGKQADLSSRAHTPQTREAALQVYLYELKSANELYMLALVNEPRCAGGGLSSSISMEEPDIQWFSRKRLTITAIPDICSRS